MKKVAALLVLMLALSACLFAWAEDANAPLSDVSAGTEQTEQTASETEAQDEVAPQVSAVGESVDAEPAEESDDEEEEQEKLSVSTIITLIVSLAVCVALAALAVMMLSRKNSAMFKNTRMLVESAVMVALATVLSMLKIDLPFGGGVTIVSMLPLVVISHRWGWKWGVITAFVYSAIQLVLGLDNLVYATSIPIALGIIFLDYILAYTVIGLSGIFDRFMGKTRASVATGIVVTFLLRLACHYMTGVWIWDGWMPDKFMGMAMTSPYIYSLLYNGWYMMAEIVITEIVTMLAYAPLGKFLKGEAIRKA